MIDPILVAHVADQLQFDDSNLSYDKAAHLADAMLEVDSELVMATANYAADLTDVNAFARHVRKANR